jgi:hypothetical protein
MRMRDVSRFHSLTKSCAQFTDMQQVVPAGKTLFNNQLQTVPFYKINFTLLRKQNTHLLKNTKQNIEANTGVVNLKR